MLEEIIELWTKEGLLKQSRGIILQMFNETKHMYEEAMLSFWDENCKGFDMNKEDEKVNKMHMDVRKKVLMHLSVSPAQDISASLIFMYVVNDLERIGDYCKNIWELSELYPKKISRGPYMNEFREIEAAIVEDFELSKKAFSKSDEKSAKEAVYRHLATKKRIDELIKKVMKDGKLGVDEAVSYALHARFLRRIDSHLKNVATAMINPFERIGYKIEENNH